MGLRHLHHRSPTNARRPYQASRDSARTPRSEMEQARALSSHNLLSKSDCQKQHGAPIVTPLGVTMTHRSHSCKMPPPDPRLFDVDFKSRAADALRHCWWKHLVPISVWTDQDRTERFRMRVLPGMFLVSLCLEAWPEGMPRRWDAPTETNGSGLSYRSVRPLRAPRSPLRPAPLPRPALSFP